VSGRARVENPTHGKYPTCVSGAAWRGIWRRGIKTEAACSRLKRAAPPFAPGTSIGYKRPCHPTVRRRLSCWNGTEGDREDRRVGRADSTSAGFEGSHVLIPDMAFMPFISVKLCPPLSRRSSVQTGSPVSEGGS
jgi:hypothetical protein